MEIQSLVQQAKTGDKQALLKLIMSEKENYYHLAYTYLNNEHDAMDALEDMIIKLYDHIHQLRQAELFYSWSKTILVNICKQKLKKNAKLVELQEDNRLIEGHEEQQVNTIYVNELLNNLNPQQKEAIQLKYFFDFDLQTIAKLTNSSLGTVKSRIHNGLQKMKEIAGREQKNGY